MLIKGWVTPKYLDENWYSSFTITKNKKRENDVPVVISVHDKAFDGAKNINKHIDSYGDLEHKLKQTQQRLEECEEALGLILNNYEMCSQNPHNPPSIQHGYLDKARKYFEKYKGGKE